MTMSAHDRSGEPTMITDRGVLQNPHVDAAAYRRIVGDRVAVAGS